MLPVDGLADEAKCEDLKKFAVGDDPEKFFQVGSQLPPQEKEKLVEVLKRNIDVFAWNAYEAPGVDLSFICHHLNVNPSITPRKQPSKFTHTNRYIYIYINILIHKIYIIIFQSLIH